MLLQDLLRHVADNVEAGRDGASGLTFNGRKIGLGSTGSISFNLPDGYELTPKTVTINGIEVQAGESGELGHNEKYYCASVATGKLYFDDFWNDIDVDFLALKRGLVHKTKEAAIAMAVAMISFERVK